MSFIKREYKIEDPRQSDAVRELAAKIDLRTKPFGAFGFLGEVLSRLAGQQNSVKPRLLHPALLIFGGDHGIAGYLSGINSEAESAQLVSEILHGDSPLQRSNQQSRYKMKVVDLGLNYRFEANINYWLQHGNRLVNARQGEGSADLTQYPSLTSAQAEEAWHTGARLISREHHYRSNFLAFAGLGDGQMVSNLALISAVYDQLPEKIFPNDLLADPYLIECAKLAGRAVQRHPKTHDPFTILTLYGGFEHLALCGAMLRAAECRISFLVDNLSALIALYFAGLIDARVNHYAFLPATIPGPVAQLLLKEQKAPGILPGPVGGFPGLASTLALPVLKGALQFFNSEESES